MTIIALRLALAATAAGEAASLRLIRPVSVR